MFFQNMILVLDVLQDLSHNTQSISNVYHNNGGNNPSVTKVGLAQSGGCVGVQSEFLKAYTQKIAVILELQSSGENDACV